MIHVATSFLDMIIEVYMACEVFLPSSGLPFVDRVITSHLLLVGDYNQGIYVIQKLAWMVIKKIKINSCRCIIEASVQPLCLIHLMKPFDLISCAMFVHPLITDNTLCIVTA